MYSLNRIHIVGYQTQPVTVRQTPSGASVTDLNLVVPYTFTNDQGTQTGKSFHTVTVWGSMADVAGQYVRPGAQLFVSGRLQTDSWEDDQSGEKRSKTKVVAMDLILLDPKDGQLEQPADAPQLTQCTNRAEVIGNVTKDPEIRTTTSGQNVVSIGVATNERWRDKASGEDKERVEFHNIVIWGDLAEQTGKHIRKGNRVHVSGRVQTRSWETQTGSKRTTTEIIADSVNLLGVKNPAVMDAIQTDGALMAQQSAPAAAPAPEMASPDAAAAPAPAATPTPAVAYESEVKVEDLPF